MLSTSSSAPLNSKTCATYLASFFNPRLALAMAGSALGFGIVSAAPALQLLAPSQDGTVTRLSVTNAFAPNINLQSSFDLENWFHLQSATPALGAANLLITNVEPVSAWYLRAVAAAPPVIVNVGPQVDASQSVGGLIIPESGGQLQLTDSNGVFYQLTVASNLVTQPVVIQMSAITNFTGMPLTNRFRAAVSLQPDGFEFLGAAELKIRFPTAIPEAEMVGYGFDGDGRGFHLRPWDSTTNEVTLSVSHFSGAGVSAEPFPVTGSPMQNYERARTYTGDVIREADNWAAGKYRESWQRRQNGTMTAREADEFRQVTRKFRGVYIYLNAIQPLLTAAARDCAIGGVVLRRIQQLLAESEFVAKNAEYNQEIRKAALAIRCNCAHYYLESCEKNPAFSGIAATDGIREILDRSALLTGVNEDPNCNLGSDFDIQERLSRAPCHKAWEGTVRLTHIFMSSFTTTEPGSDFSYVSTEREELGYQGRITQLIEEDGGPLETGAWQSWRFKLAGMMSGNRRNVETTVIIEPKWTITDTDTTHGASSMNASGELMIRFDNGEFSWLSSESGLSTKLRMPLQRTTERRVECRAELGCPESTGPDTVSDGFEGLSFGKSPGKSPRMVAEWQKNGSLKVVVTERSIEEQPEPFRGYKERVDILTVQLFRGR